MFEKPKTLHSFPGSVPFFFVLDGSNVFAVTARCKHTFRAISLRSLAADGALMSVEQQNRQLDCE